jgi:hypothetical protein
MVKIWALLIVKGLKNFSDYSVTKQALIMPELENFVSNGIITEEQKNLILGL